MAHSRRDLFNSLWLCSSMSPEAQIKSWWNPAWWTKVGGRQSPWDKRVTWSFMTPRTLPHTLSNLIPTAIVWGEWHSILFKWESHVNWIQQVALSSAGHFEWCLMPTRSLRADWGCLTTRAGFRWKRASAASRSRVLCRNTTLDLWVCDFHVPCCLFPFPVLLRHRWRAKVAVW